MPETIKRISARKAADANTSAPAVEPGPAEVTSIRSDRLRRLVDWGRRLRSGVLAPIAGILVILVAWELAVDLFKIPKFLLVGPLAVLHSMASNPGYFATNSWVTLVESVLGFAGGAVLAIGAGLAVFYVPLLRSALYPILIGLNTVPKVAMAPLLVVWFSAGETSKIVVALLIAFFPVLVSTIDGLSGVPSELRELADIYKATALQRFLRIDFMYSLPSIFTGMKVSITMAVGGAVVGEFIAGQTGLGYVVIEGLALVDLPSVFGSFIAMTVMAFVLFLAIEAAERLLLPWARYRDA